MKIELNDFELIDWAKHVIATRYSSERPFDNSNALHHCGAGERRALEDLIALISLHGQDFYNHWQSVYDSRVAIQSPEYHAQSDKLNESGWWIIGYESIVNKLGVVLKRKEAKTVA